MIDHVGIDVRDYGTSKSFYEQVLAPLGYSLLMGFDGAACGFGRDGKPEFWIGSRDEAQSCVHLAFVGQDRGAVDAFHAAALAAGATDNGPPGPRPLYQEHYDGAYVLDPDGNNVEAVCHRPPT
jgi:catechol 2,3-dioxygenase-like lactoylglutathione lyase family enzyme